MQGRIVSTEQPSRSGTVVVKIGGSTLGSHDTSLEDVVSLRKQGMSPIVVHGGGNLITEWMWKQGVRPRFVRGLRVTDESSLNIAVAVLTGLVNKSLVASLLDLGGNPVGLSGVDGGILKARVKEPELGLVGRVVEVNTEPIRALVEAGFIPVIAPVALWAVDRPGEAGLMLNVNADTAAGEIAAALGAQSLVLLTDVEGVLDTSRRLVRRLTERQAQELMHSRVVDGGMVPKLEACITALGKVTAAHIIDGRKPRALWDVLDGKAVGTSVS